jgi:hypothetical protein
VLAVCKGLTGGESVEACKEVIFSIWSHIPCLRRRGMEWNVCLLVSYYCEQQLLL